MTRGVEFLLHSSRHTRRSDDAHDAQHPLHSSQHTRRSGDAHDAQPLLPALAFSIPHRTTHKELRGFSPSRGIVGAAHGCNPRWVARRERLLFIHSCRFLLRNIAVYGTIVLRVDEPNGDCSYDAEA